MTSVTAVLVSHDGSRWLPRVLRHLDELSRPPDRLVAVDTGSNDGSAALLREHLTSAVVIEAGPVGLGAAIRTALDTLPPAGPDATEWVWLLHDDSAPAPDALEQLLAEAVRAPDARILGPKIREWPSLRRLLEVGATVSGAGRREVGLERGEYDQGQHDEPRPVLAVGTAGMLVRRDLLDELGLDDRLPVTWSDLDLGWRANSAGHEVRVVPAAVVFHADATRTGRREGAGSASARRRTDRVGAAGTLLANAPAVLVPWVALRLLAGGILRSLGLLLVRAPREAWGEIGALPTLLRVDRHWRARRVRRSTRRVPHSAVRPLLAPWWTPYRRGVDELTDLAQAYARELRRPDDAAPRGGARAWLRPGPVVVLLVLAGSLWFWRHGGGDPASTLPGLLPPPDSAWAWWGTYLSDVHRVGVGSSSPAPPYLLPMALLGTVAGGSAVAATALVLLLALPLAGAGAYRLLRRTVPPLAASALALGYVLVVAMSGALAQGRLGTLTAAAVAPWVVTAAGGLGSADAYVRRRAAWRTALLLWLAASFVPGLLAPALVGSLVLAAVLARAGRPFLAALLPVPVTAVLLLPWSAMVWLDAGWRGLLDEAGPDRGPGVSGPSFETYLLARPGVEGAAPSWLSIGIVVLAVLATLRRSTRPRVAGAWAAAVVLLAWGVAVAALVEGAAWAGTPLVLSHGALLSAVAAASVGLREELVGRAFGVRQVLGTAAASVAVGTLTLGVGWWVGAHPVAVDRVELPPYMTTAAAADPAVGALVLRGDVDGGLVLEVRRSGGPHLGDEALAPDPQAQERVAAAVAALTGSPGPDVVEALAAEGIEFVVLPAPVDGRLGAALDAAPGLGAASAGEGQDRAWRADTEPSLPPAPSGSEGLRSLLLVVQMLGLVAVAVLAAPGRRPGHEQTR